MPSAPARAVIIAVAIGWLAALLLLPPRASSWIVVACSLPLLAIVSWHGARRAGQPWRRFLGATPDWHVLGLALAYGLGVLVADTHGITTDGAIYFSQLRSLVFDRDLVIDREFELLGQPPRPHHVVPLGPLVVWTPLYLATALVDALGRTAGLWTGPADDQAMGLGLPYIRAALVSSFLLAAAGLLMLHARLRREFTRGVALAATLLLFGATSLFWYMVYEPSMTHAASFGAVALFVVCADRWLPGAPNPRRMIVLGFVLGLAFAIRPQEVVFAIFAAALLLTRAGSPRQQWRDAIGLAGWGLVGALPWLLLQLAHSATLFSLYSFRLAGEGGYLRPFDSRWSDVLFSSWHGFLSWTPVAYIAVLGTVAYAWRNWRWAVAGLLILALMTWINGAADDWAAGWAFGGRRFTSVLVMLAPGLALVIDSVRRRPLLAIAPLVAAALVWNHLLMVQYASGLLPKDEPVSFARLVRQQADVHTRGPYFYPFAFPANLWFAWREGLPVDRYDLLAVEPRRHAIDLVMDRRADRFLLEGWDAPGGDDWGLVWWIGRREASLALPLALSADREIAIMVRARTRFEEPTVTAELGVVVNGHEVGRFAAPAETPGEAVFTVAAADARRIWRAGYNRVTFVSHGVRRVDPADHRPPGPIASRPGQPAWPVAIYRIQIEPR